jgi:Zn-dependent M16 (insulinase) family peptidase
MSLPSAAYNHREQPAELVLAHQLSTGALWEEIRMKGGAYGAFAHTDSLEGIFSLATYRDPNPARSLESFGSALKDMAQPKKGSPWFRDEDSLEKAVIGTYAKETRPRTGAEKGAADFIRYLYGVEYETRRQKLEWLVQVSADEIAAALNRLASANSAPPVIVAGTAIAEKAAKALGVEPRVLPV